MANQGAAAFIKHSRNIILFVFNVGIPGFAIKFSEARRTPVVPNT